jgi:hypothetical protein
MERVVLVPAHSPREPLLVKDIRDSLTLNAKSEFDEEVKKIDIMTGGA